jgi:hypothetical protein
MGNISFPQYIFFLAMLMCLLQPRLLAQADANPSVPNNDSASWTATTENGSAARDANPTRTSESHSEEDGRTVDKTVTQRLGFDGSYTTYLETEKESVRVDSSTVRTVERLYGRDPNGGKTLVRVTEEERRSQPDGETTVVRTVSDSTVNGGLQVIKREMQETRQSSPNVQETTTTVLSPEVNGGFSPSVRFQERSTRSGDHDVQSTRTTLLPDGNGNWQVNERRESTIQDENGKNQTKEENVWRRNAEGNLSVVQRTVSKESEEAPGEQRKTVETFSNTVPGGFSDGGLILNQRVTTMQRPRSDGGKVTEQQVEQNSAGDPRGGVRLTQKTINIVRPGSDGTTQEQRTIQSVDSNGSLSTVWVDTRQQSGGSSIVVDTRNPSPTQPKPGERPAGNQGAR